MKSAYGLSIPQTLEEVCDPPRVALVVYEMQVGILSQIKNADQMTRQVLKVLTAARNAGVRVFFSRHLSLPKELMGMFQFRIAMAWQRGDSPDQVNPWFLRDTPGFQIISELSPLPSALDRKLEVFWGCNHHRHRDDLPGSPKVIRHSERVNLNRSEAKILP